MLPVAAALVSTVDHLESMKVAFRNVAEKAKKNDGAFTPTDKSVIQTWLDTMNTTLFSALQAEKADYQRILDGAFDTVEGCLTSRTNTFNSNTTGGVANFAYVRDVARNSHLASKNCGEVCNAGSIISGHKDSTGGATGFVGQVLLQAKLPTDHNYTYDTTRHWGKEGTTMTFQMSDADHVAELALTTCEENAYDDMFSDCTTILDEHVKTMYADIQSPQDWCVPPVTERPAHGAAHPYTSKISSRDFYDWEAQETDAVNNWFQAMSAFNNSNVMRYKAEREACHDARRAHTHRVHRTHSLQAQFERDYCAWTNAVGETCHVYQGCYQSTSYTHASVKSITETVETQLKAQQAALECVICYGEQILNNSTDLSGCDAVTGCENCDPLTIDYKTPHTMQPCEEASEIAEQPGTATWMNNEYGCFDNTAPHNDIDTCSDETATWPAWPANATSE